MNSTPVLVAEKNLPTHGIMCTTLVITLAFAAGASAFCTPIGSRCACKSIGGSQRLAETILHRRATAAPCMGFADWGKGDKTATASHILVKSREEAMKIKEKIEAGRVSFGDAAEMFSTCGTSSEGGCLGSFAPGEMVPAFDAYCFDPETELGAIGVVDTEFGTHLVKLQNQNLPAHVRNSGKVKTFKMLDTPDPRTGLRG